MAKGGPVKFWDNVNTELKKAVEDSWSVMKESARIGKLRFQINGLEKKAQNLCAQIGGIVYDASSDLEKNPLQRTDVQELVKSIKAIEDEVAALEQEIKNIKGKEPANAR